MAQRMTRPSACLMVVSHMTTFYDGNVYHVDPVWEYYLSRLAPFFRSVKAIMVVVNRRGDEHVVPITNPGIEIVPLLDWPNDVWTQSPPLWRLRVIASLAHHLRGSDLVEIKMPSYIGFAGLCVAALLRRPRYLVVVGDWMASRRLLGKENVLARLAVSAMVAASAKLAPLVFAVGDELTTQYLKWNRRTFSTYEGSWLSDSIAVQERTPREVCDLLFVGRLTHAKGLHVLFDALGTLRDIDRRWRLRIAGNGDERYFREYAAHAGIEGLVEFCGFQNQIALKALYDASDVLVLPSFSEGVPKVVLEGLAQGLVVVSTNVGGVSSILSHQHNGFLVKPGDVFGLARVLADIIGDPKLRRAVSARSVRSAEQFSSHSAMMRRFEVTSAEFGVPEEITRGSVHP